MRYFTSDWHLGSSNINKYANRPFTSAGDAAGKLVDNCNEVARWKTDVVFHVGDYFLKGNDKHDDVIDVNTLTENAKGYLNFINARFILLEGNHDKSNVESDLKSMMIDLNHNYRDVFVTHYPSDNPAYHGRSCTNWKSGIGINLCGHVHQKWLFKFDSQKNILNINVGVDVWNYRPVRDADITELLDFIKTTMWTKIKNIQNFMMTRDDIEKFKIAHLEEVKKVREERKQERYAKKGLTPEICQMRKEEALRKKGLLK